MKLNENITRRIQCFLCCNPDDITTGTAETACTSIASEGWIGEERTLSEKRQLVTNTLANGVAQFAGIVSAIVFMPLLIRGFGLREYGLYMLAGSVGAYASLLDLGVGTSLAKMVAESAATDDKDRARRLASSALAFYLVVGLLSASVIVVVALNAGSIFRVTPDGARLLRNMLLISAVSSLWAWPANTAGAVLAGRQRYVLSSRTAVGAILGNIAVTVVVLVTHNGPVALMAGSALIALAASSVNAYLAWNELGRGASPLWIRSAR